ncbi:xylulokinase [Clostridium sp. Cult2]|uniref:xylulokinase n=1 Tax=Clostridium sp. Cult2 TaxID=2079003 RepID=UPI001F02F2A1|nr:xylulokinase [Clostridium sp. Cult2]MCF6466233.1 xylulokinase [Clostridium sp. Cult2]
MYFVGIDIGTSSVKLLIINEKGEIINSVSKEYPIYFPQPSWSEQNPEGWWEQTLIGLKELLKGIDGKSVKAISFSGQMHGLVTLDKNDNIIRPAILWNDQRTEKECLFLNNTIGREKISHWTGNIALTGFTAPKILWLKENEPDNFEKIEKIMLPKDYIAYKMSGVFATDYSDASGTLYLDVKNKKWSEDMLDILGISVHQLPKLYESYEAIGNINKDLADELGLNDNVKIVIGGGDQAVAAVGGGIVNEYECSVSLGTSGVIFANTKDFLVDDNNRLHSFCNANGKYHVMGVTLAAAASLKWWVEKINKSARYDEIVSEITKADVNKNIFFLPYLMGERTPHNDPNARGVFIGMDMTNEKKDMTRAVLEGVAFSLRDTFEIMKDMGINISEITINGGGARNQIWCQIISDILNVKVNKVNSEEGPSYGAAILATVGHKLFDTVDEACNSFIKVNSTIHPNPDLVNYYDEKYKKYKLIYPSIKGLYKELN